MGNFNYSFLFVLFCSLQKTLCAPRYTTNAEKIDLVNLDMQTTLIKKATQNDKKIHR